MKSSKGQEIEIETFVEKTPYEEGIVVVEGTKKTEEDGEYSPGSIRMEDPDEIIEPGSKVLYEEPGGPNASEEYKRELREQFKEFAGVQDIDVFMMPQETANKYNHPASIEQEVLQAYDTIVMGVSCTTRDCCGREGQLRLPVRLAQSEVGDSVGMWTITEEIQEQLQEQLGELSDLDLVYATTKQKWLGNPEEDLIIL